ncbi:MAG: alpha/beta hydrolase family protein [Acidobacteriota bacterium]
MLTSTLKSVAAFLVFAWVRSAQAAVGFVELPATESSGPVSVFYPTDSPGKAEQHGPFQFDMATDAPPATGPKQLVVISPGSGASPWVYFDLAALLVQNGFVVAMPEHAGDNIKDRSGPGPASWKLRPVEVSRAIDRVAADPRLQTIADTTRVGMYGMSAGGHTALSLAGGRWSPVLLKQHCNQHIDDDFYACAGLSTRLTGGFMDKVKRSLVQWVIGLKFNDSTWYSHTDSRIAAIVSGVPFAADFDLDSLRAPSVPVGIISARMDKWLASPYHAGAVLQACGRCEFLADLPHGGHGALLSPLPPDRSGLLADLINDPPEFDRAVEVPQVSQKIVDFFKRHLRTEGPVGRSPPWQKTAPKSAQQEAS